jgi:hypothetical protein
LKPLQSQPLRQHPLRRSAAWLCRRQARARCTRLRLFPLPLRAPPRQRLGPAFSAIVPSSTGVPALRQARSRADTLRVRRVLRDSSPAALVLSIRRVPHPVDSHPVVVLAVPADGPDLGSGPDLRVPADGLDSAVRAPVDLAAAQVLLSLRAKLRVRSAPPRPRAVAVASSIRRPRKAR